MEGQKKYPELRFEGFTEDWETEEVGYYYEFKNGLNKGKEFFGYGKPIVNFTDVFHKRGLYAFDLKGKVDVTKDEINNYSVRKGDLFFTRTSETIEEIGQPSVMLDEPEDAVFSGFVLRARALDIDPLEILFKKFAFNTSTFRSEMVKKSSMTTRALTSGTAIKKMFFSFPKNKDEQRRIGTYITQVEILIEEHQKKHNRLITLKKSMLEKMFPKEGQTVPEIRFKGFEGDWEECEFQEIATLKRGLTYSPSNLRKTGTRVLRSSNIFENRFINRVDDVFVEDTAINIDYVKEGDILITAANGSSKLVGKHALITGIKGKVVHGGFMLLASSNVPLFLNASMSSSWYKKFVNLYTAGGGGSIGNLSKSDLDQQRIYVPTDENEQLKIGKYFQNIDTLITNHLEQLDKLKNFKQSLSEKMFV